MRRLVIFILYSNANANALPLALPRETFRDANVKDQNVGLFIEKKYKNWKILFQFSWIKVKVKV